MFPFPKKSTDLREQIKAHRSEITSALESVRGRIAKLEAERAALRTSHITRDDYAAAVLAHIDRKADEQLGKMAIHFRYCAEGIAHNGRSSATVGKALEAARNPLPSDRESLFGMPLQDNQTIAPNMTFAVFRDEIKRASAAAIARLPWFGDCVSLEAAQSRLSEIDAELSQLRADESELAAEAAEFGAEK